MVDDDESDVITGAVHLVDCVPGVSDIVGLFDADHSRKAEVAHDLGAYLRFVLDHEDQQLVHNTLLLIPLPPRGAPR